MARSAAKLRSSDLDGDLPLTAFFRKHSATIAAATVVLAIAALAGFVVPFLMGR